MALLALASPAQGATAHRFIKQITQIPGRGPHGELVTHPGKLSGVDALSVDSGEVYAAEHMEGTGEDRIDAFEAATGEFTSQFPGQPLLSGLGVLGLSVGHSTGQARVYLGAESGGEGVVAVFDATGGSIGGWTGFGPGGVVGVAADDSPLSSWTAGDVFVAHPTEQAMEGKPFVVEVFKALAAGATNELVATLKGACPDSLTKVCTSTEEEEHPFLLGPEGSAPIAADAQTGDLLVTTAGTTVDVFAPAMSSGQFEALAPLTGPPPPSPAFREVRDLATDATNGEIYVSDQVAQTVFEFAANGEFEGELTEDPGGDFTGLRSVAVDGETHHVYVGNFDSQQHVGVIDEYGPDVVLPDATAGGAGFEPTELTPTEVTLHGTVNPDEAGAATCAFEYGTSTEYGESAGCAGLGTEKSPIPGEAGDNTPVSVESALTGLAPDTTYFYRLAASNARGTNTGRCPKDCGSFTTHGPGLHGEYATQVTSSSATLNALVDPDNGPTSVYFQYGRTTAYEEGDLPAAPGVPLGAGTGDVHAEQHPQGLAAATEYHYRAVAVSEWAHGRTVEVPGADHVLTTLPLGAQFSLSDGRAWELVSPADKHGSQLQWPDEEGGLFQSSLQGDAFTYLASGPTEAGAPGASQEVQLLATRGAASSTSPGWSSSDISLAHREATGTRFGLGEEYRFFSEDFSQAVAQPFGPEFDPLISPQAEEQTAYLRNNSSGTYTPLVTRADDTARPFEPFGEEFAIAIAPTEPTRHQLINR